MTGKPFSVSKEIRHKIWAKNFTPFNPFIKLVKNLLYVHCKTNVHLVPNINQTVSLAKYASLNGSSKAYPYNIWACQILFETCMYCINFERESVEISQFGSNSSIRSRNKCSRHVIPPQSTVPPRIAFLLFTHNILHHKR